MEGSTAAHPTAGRPGWPALIGTVALGIAAVSALGLLVLIVGDIAGIKGAKENEQGWVGFDVAWVAFFVGAILSLVTGAMAYVMGRRSADPPTRTAGLLAMGWTAAAVILGAVISSLS